MFRILKILAQKRNEHCSRCTDQFTKYLKQVQWLARNEITAMWALCYFWNKFVPKLGFMGPIYYFSASKLGCKVPQAFFTRYDKQNTSKYILQGSINLLIQQR